MNARILVPCLFFVAGAAVGAEVPLSAVHAAESYSVAFNANDCHGLVALLSPSETRRLIRDTGSTRGYCELVAQFHAEGVTDRLRAPRASVASGAYRMVVFPNSRVGLTARGQPVITEGTYVVHSSDSGRTWHVLDLSCIDARWVKEIYPPYKGTPKITPAKSALVHGSNDL